MYLLCACAIFCLTTWRMHENVDQVPRESLCGFCQDFNFQPWQASHFMINYWSNFFCILWMLVYTMYFYHQFFYSKQAIRSPFQGVHNILRYKITMDLGWREPYLSIAWPVCFKTPLLMLPLGLAGLEEAPSVLWKCPAKVNLIKLSSTENIIGWDILVFCKVVVLLLSHKKKKDLICHR